MYDTIDIVNINPTVSKPTVNILTIFFTLILRGLWLRLYWVLRKQTIINNMIP